MFYKVIQNQTVIDVLESLNYVKFQTRNHIIIRCNSNENPMGILSSDSTIIWHLDNLNNFPIDGYETVRLVEIDEEEYIILKEALDSNKIIDEPEIEIDIDNEETEIEPTEEEIIDNNTLDMVRTSKIQEMNKTCNKVITDGFDIVLSDGLTHHFSLEITDQLKISKLNDRANNGQELLPYHADDEVCKFYSSDDIIAINTKMEYVIEYHTTYYNSLKTYIQSCSTIQEISDIYYGVDIPEEYQSEVLVVLLNQNINQT